MGSYKNPIFICYNILFQTCQIALKIKDIPLIQILDIILC